MTTRGGRLAFVAALLGATGLAYAVDQQILGKALVVKDPGSPGKQKVGIQAREPGSPNVVAGDPVSFGGTLTVSLSGGTPSNQFFDLPAGASGITGKPFWSGDVVKGFRYKDIKGENGAVRSAEIRKSASGTFSVKAKILGRLGTVTLVPPNPGTDACVLLAVNGGPTYSVKFGPGDGIVTNKDATLYKHRKITTEGTCTFIASTTSTSTSTVTTSSTTTTTLYGSPSRAFVDRVASLLE